MKKPCPAVNKTTLRQSEVDNYLTVRVYIKSMTRTLGAILLSLLAGVTLAQGDFNDLPDLGDSTGLIYSPQQDRALGTAFMRELRQEDLILDDPEATRYLASLGRKLTVHSENPGHGFSFFVVNDPRINAFAGPAGHIGANSGLILAAETESELAAVLAHEIAHITQRHLARAFETADKLSIPTTAAILAAILIGTQNGQAGAAAITAASAANMQSQINFTRSNEQEADRVGIQTLEEAGFDPNGMASFFERLQKNSRLYGTHPPEFLSTHPVTTNRIAEAESRASSYPKVHVADNIDFQLIRAKLRVMSYDNPAQVLSDYQRYHGAEGGDTAAERYEYALLLSANEHYPEAVKVMTALQRADPDRLAYRLALGAIYQRAHEYQQALTVYKSANNLFPGETALVLPYATTLMATGAADTAYQLLLDASNTQPDEPQIYKLLAQAAGDTGNSAQTHTALSQYFYLTGFTDKAIEQLQLAAKTKDLSDYQATRIQARLTQLQTVRKSEEEGLKN
jgi:predicted Zn-dependent protease